MECTENNYVEVGWGICLLVVFVFNFGLLSSHTKMWGGGFPKVQLKRNHAMKLKETDTN